MTHQPDPISHVTTLPGLLIEPAWLQEQLGAPDLRLIDIRAADEYREAHIPGAVQLDLSALVKTVDGVQGMLIDPADYATIMGNLGIDNRSAVVLYDSNWGMPAARVLWSLAYYGHMNAAVLNGGWDRWKEEDRPTETTSPSPTPSEFEPRPDPAHLAKLEWLQSRTAPSEPAHSDLVLIDTRTKGEFEQGHLPGALLWDWMNGVPPGSWNTLRPSEELVAELTGLGVTPDKEIVTYCRSGARAAHTYLLLRHLGYPRVRNYDGSWLEWSARVLGEAAE